MTLGGVLTMPLAALLLTATAILMLDRHLPARRLATWVALAGLVTAAALSLISFASGQGGGGQGMLAMDGTTVLSSLLLCGVGGATALFDAAAGRERAGRSALGLFAILGGEIVAWAAHLLAVLVGLGTVQAAIATRGGRHRQHPYPVLHGAGLACAAMGVVLLYGGTGSMRLDVLLPRMRRQAALGLDSLLASSGLGLILAGAGLGLGLVPFHSWLLDACHGAGRSDGVLLSLVMPGTSFLLLMRLRSGFTPRMMGLLATLGTWSVVAGYFYALRAGRLRAALAGLAIAQSGRLAMALAFDTSPALLFYHLLAGGLALLLLWTTTVADTRGREERSGMSAAITALALLSLAGMLPLPGGVSNLLLWQATWADGHPWDIALLAIGGLMNWLFTGRWMYRLWLRPPDRVVRASLSIELSVVALAAALMLTLSGTLAPLVLTRFAELLATLPFTF